MRALTVWLFLASAPAFADKQALDLTPDPIALVSFETGSYALEAGANDELAGVVGWVHAHPWRLVVIQGYADHVGGATMNLRLSQNRADAVRTRLIELGVPPDRIISASYGEEDPEAARKVVVNGTLGDFQELIERQHEIHTPSPRGVPPQLTRPPETRLGPTPEREPTS